MLLQTQACKFEERVLDDYADRNTQLNVIDSELKKVKVDLGRIENKT